MAPAKQLKTMEMCETWLILSMRDIYINSNLITKFISSSRSTAFKDILPWNIFQMIMKTVPITTRIVISNVMEWGIPLWIWWKVSGNSDKNMIKISQWRESHCRTNTSVRRNKSKRAGLWESLSGIQAEKLTIWVRSLETEKLWQSSPDLSVPPELLSQSILAYGLIERKSMLDEIKSKTVHKENEGDWLRKKK